MANDEEVRSIVDFFTRDSDADRFCGLRADPTPAQVEERFGAGCFSTQGLAIFNGREIEVTKVKRTGELVLGAVPYTCMVEVLIPAAGVAQVDVRLRREGYVLTELKAAARELKQFYAPLYPNRLRSERGQIWIETSGVKKADEAFGLTPCASLRVQSSRR